MVVPVAKPGVSVIASLEVVVPPLTVPLTLILAKFSDVFQLLELSAVRNNRSSIMLQPEAAPASSTLDSVLSILTVLPPLYFICTKYVVFAVSTVFGGAVNVLILSPVLPDRLLGLLSVANDELGRKLVVPTADHSFTTIKDKLDCGTDAKSISIDSRV